MATTITHKQLEEANEAINEEISEKISARNDLDAEIDALQNQHTSEQKVREGRTKRASAIGRPVLALFLSALTVAATQF